MYGNLAPDTRLIGSLDCGKGSWSGELAARRSLYVYSMSRIPGFSLAECRIKSGEPGSTRLASLRCRESLVREFARFLSRAWKARRLASDRELSRLKGRVGSSLRWRLEAMQRDLPQRFRPIVERVLVALPKIEELPWILTHGDVVPSNIMVEPESSSSSLDESQGLRLTGLLDWAEAEYLPFGVALYGAEELFGQTEVLWDGVGPYPPRGSRFVYFDDSSALRAAFWLELEEEVPELVQDCKLREAVETARLLGILLWHGIAFDGGRLSRVVSEGVDDEEIQRLDLFLLRKI